MPATNSGSLESAQRELLTIGFRLDDERPKYEPDMQRAAELIREALATADQPESQKVISACARCLSLQRIYEAEMRKIERARDAPKGGKRGRKPKAIPASAPAVIARALADTHPAAHAETY